ncbi:MAG: FeoB small GTPase domain-containing protein [Phycisphaerae bacterium]
MGSCKQCVAGCDPAAEQAQWVPLSLGRDPIIALAGNPNTGKSTIFNHLTGLRQHTGNWPGKTVSRAEGTFTHAGRPFTLVDLPGTYSLTADSTDEEIARDFVLFERPDCTVVVCDATVLERNLLLVLQMLEITDRVVLCLNLMDEADRKQIALEARLLEKELGVPVVPTVARRGQGLEVLVRTIAEVAMGRRATDPKRVRLDEPFEAAIAELGEALLALLPNVACPRWIALRLLEGDRHIEQALLGGQLADLFGAEGRNQANEAAA